MYTMCARAVNVFRSRPLPHATFELFMLALS
jgi:hypothetical protein